MSPLVCGILLQLPKQTRMMSLRQLFLFSFRVPSRLTRCLCSPVLASLTQEWFLSPPVSFTALTFSESPGTCFQELPTGRPACWFLVTGSGCASQFRIHRNDACCPHREHWRLARPMAGHVSCAHWVLLVESCALTSPRGHGNTQAELETLPFSFLQMQRSCDTVPTNLHAHLGTSSSWHLVWPGEKKPTGPRYGSDPLLTLKRFIQGTR